LLTDSGHLGVVASAAWGSRQWADGERRGLRAPLVCGVAGGVGTTTIAAALQARDLGVYHGGPADIVICRTTSTSVAAAHRVVNTAPGKPVLVVVADGPLRTPAPVRARLTMVGPHITALVAMPYVPRWREIDQPLEQAAAILRVPPDQVPKWLQPWATALKQLMNAVIPLVDRPPEVPAGPTTADVLPRRHMNGNPNPPPHPRTAVDGQGPGIVQESRPSPPPAAAQ
jgi:hypothetical protein